MKTLRFKNTDKIAYVSIEGTPAKNRIFMPLYKAIVSLANTEGGQVLMIRKIKQKYDYIPTNNAELYENVIGSALRDIENNIGKDVIQYWGRDAIEDDQHCIFSINVANFSDGLLSVRYSNNVEQFLYRDNGNIARINSSTKGTAIEKKIIKQRILRPNRTLDLNGKRCEAINMDSEISHAYKYMTLDAFVSCMNNKTLRLVEPTKWLDEYEGRFYHADFTKKLGAPADSTPTIYATCITENVASEAAWKVYSHGVGLGARCVQVKLNIENLYKQLCGPLVIKVKGKEEIIQGQLYVGKVYYDLSDDEINNLHKSGKTFHDTFFSNFCLNKFIRLLLIKRVAYKHENEIRLFFVKEPFVPISKRRKGSSIDVCLNWGEIIEEIKVDACCTDSEILALKYSCRDAGIAIADPSKKGRKKKGDIPLIKVNIDKMMGRKKIEIQK